MRRTAVVSIPKWYNSKFIHLTAFIFSKMFQFQNGTIQRVHLVIIKKAFTQFQFQNGTIQRILPIAEPKSPIMFQFQNGTIQSEFEVFNTGTLFEFQFQNGTIQRGLLWRGIA